MADKKFDQYLGPIGIISVSERDDIKTNQGNIIVELKLSDGSSRVIPRSAFEQLVTLEPTDYNSLRERKINSITKIILGFLAETDIMHDEVPDLVFRIHSELNNGFNRAMNYLWTKNDKLFTPGANALDNCSLVEADLIIRDIVDSDEGSGGESQ